MPGELRQRGQRDCLARGVAVLLRGNRGAIARTGCTGGFRPARTGAGVAGLLGCRTAGWCVAGAYHRGVDMRPLDQALSRFRCSATNRRTMSWGESRARVSGRRWSGSRSSGLGWVEADRQRGRVGGGRLVHARGNARSCLRPTGRPRCRGEHVRRPGSRSWRRSPPLSRGIIEGPSCRWGDGCCGLDLAQSKTSFQIELLSRRKQTRQQPSASSAWWMSARRS